MVTWVHARHLAHSHSPTREQRELFVDDPNANDRERSPEEMGGGGEGGVDVPHNVEHIRQEEHAKVDTVTPELVLEDLVEHGDGIFDLLMASTKVDAELERAAQGGLASLEQAGHLEKGALIESVLSNLSDEKLIEVLQMVESKLRRHEELLKIAENHIRILEKGIPNTPLKGGADRSAIEQAIAVFEAKGGADALSIALENGTITKANVARALRIQRVSSPEERELLLAAVVSIAEANRIRETFGQRWDTDRTAAGRRSAREQFLEELRRNHQTVSSYLDGRLGTHAAKLIDRCVELSNEYDGPETLERFGITADGFDEALRANVETLRVIRRDFEGMPTPDRANYLEHAESAVRQLQEIEDGLQSTERGVLPPLFREQQAKEEGSLKWAEETANAIKKAGLEQKLRSNESTKHLCDLLAPLLEGRDPTTDELVGLRLIEQREQQTVSRMVTSLAGTPDLLEKVRNTPGSADIEPGEAERIIQETRAELERVLPIFASIDHPVMKVLELNGRIQKQARSIRANLEYAETAGMDGKGSEELRRAREMTQNLYECAKRINDIYESTSGLVQKVEKREDYTEITGIDSFGYYRYSDGVIFLNMKKIREENRNPGEVLRHEMGHAIVDAFRRTNVFPNMLLPIYAKLQTQKTDDGIPFDKLLLAQAPTWGIPIANPASLTSEEQHKLMDELVNRFSEWNENGRSDVGINERSLFSLFESRAENDEAPTLSLTGGVHQHDDGGGGAMGVDGGGGGIGVGDAGLEGGGAEGGAPEGQMSFTDTEIHTLDKQMERVEAFLVAYPEYIPEAYEEYSVPELREALARLKEKKKTGDVNDDEFRETVSLMKKFLEGDAEIGKEGLIKAIKKIDRAKSDLTSVEKTIVRSPWQILTEDAIWISFYDVKAFFKDAADDIVRMWKRRSEGARNRLGKEISELISNRVPYLGRLKHEFERRSRESEEAEVGVWEKGLEKIDSHELQHEFIPRVHTRDQLKAIMNLLAKRGRLDWDDEHLWSKLEYFSGYEMPREACRRDNILRNQYLQKMIADIFRDKDRFEHWKAENDAAIKSGTEHLVNYADDISAIGGLERELKRLLENQWKLVRGQPISKEEEVNPHLYEELIFYAMKNGKASMEGKFFYLVKGVEIGLISVDRLRAFSGENFGILNSFPFIDFFSTGQNNTRFEINRMARQITERDGDPYSPGVRTTKFLYEIVAFDKNVADRVNKSLRRAENIDHEDIPMLLTQVDYAGVNLIVNFTSGSQAKISAQGMMNGYVGYNSFMKYFGVKSKIGQPPISDRDISKIAATLGAYSLWDNQITRNSIGSPTTVQRPYLSWEQINEQTPVISNIRTRVYRDNMNKFTVELCKAIGLTEINGIAIEDFIGLRRNANSLADLRAKYPDKFTKDEDVYNLMVSTPPLFVTELSKNLKASPGALNAVLQRFESTFLTDSPDFDEANMRRVWDMNGNGLIGDSSGPRAHAAH